MAFAPLHTWIAIAEKNALGNFRTRPHVNFEDSLNSSNQHTRAAKIFVVHFSLERPKYAPLSSPNSIVKEFPYQIPIQSNAGI